ncbi:hypothetical protein TCAL_10482 [Tigriopus californicus]|uniref:Beta-1,4-N-acetylgalactosaminyltransferase n=1 Tax=Tigriopus californicus TaxID=6832 RepID=A0A553PRZ9_TIGCA|nr:hypothetical protein TCAL_10482 [Tigriopus californicus]|eukprot:TCALIF_10482-PA protein Name:"Similar to B4galt4 Beta-1,4-galactosyltransferase 4 (Rattus norvegicus)" AED:0.13 eAED:0.13 QI:106/1/1/1/0.75/0.77/9/33/367
MHSLNIHKMRYILKSLALIVIILIFGYIFVTSVSEDSIVGGHLNYFRPVSYIPMDPPYPHMESNTKQTKQTNDQSGQSSKTNLTYPSKSIVCPPIPPSLVGKLKVNEVVHKMDSIEASVGSEMSIGGKYSPRECMARHKVAIVLPYRNRKAQLALFLEHMHPILKRQQLDYGIYVVNQADSNEFNRAMLFNVGFVEALKEANWDCFIFHDVDLLPEDDRNLYTCPDTPRHMSVAVNTLKYKLPYAGIFGGVVALTKSHILTLNGFSNQFWGWGGEDDDMANRVAHYKMTVSRYKPAIARYTMAKHKKEKPSEQRLKVLKDGHKYFNTDGLNNLQYDLVSKKQFLLYTSISVALKHVQPLALLPASNS